MLPRLVTLSLALTLVAAGPPGPPLRSGPQVGEGINGGFVVQPVNGLYAGKRCCPV